MELIEKFFAEELIKAVPDIFLAVSSDIVSHKSRKIKKIPKIKDWLSYYRNSKLIFETTVINLLSDIEFNSDIQDCDIGAFIDRRFDKISRDDALTYISDHNLQFFIRIIIPCLLLYGQFPSMLMRRARMGDEDSIEKLARIDYAVIHDFKISQHIFELSFRNPTRHELLINSIIQDHQRLEIDQIKMRVAALISHINTLFSIELEKKRVTYPQIRKLFVNEAKLHGFEDDIDLPLGEDAFSRRIRRNNIWHELFKVPDKN